MLLPVERAAKPPSATVQHARADLFVAPKLLRFTQWLRKIRPHLNSRSAPPNSWRDQPFSQGTGGSVRKATESRARPAAQGPRPKTAFSPEASAGGTSAGLGETSEYRPVW